MESCKLQDYLGFKCIQFTFWQITVNQHYKDHVLNWFFTHFIYLSISMSAICFINKINQSTVKYCWVSGLVCCLFIKSHPSFFFGDNKVSLNYFHLTLSWLKLNRNNIMWQCRLQQTQPLSTRIRLPTPSALLSGLLTKIYRKATARDSGLKRKKALRPSDRWVRGVKQKSLQGRIKYLKVKHVALPGSPAGRNEEEQQYSAW